LREERRLRVFDNSVLKRILGPKRDKVMGDWRKLHYKKFSDLYCSPNIIRVIEKNMVFEACSTYGGEERMYRILVRKPEGKTYLEDPGVDERIILT
jgi:hypothetical protein